MEKKFYVFVDNVSVTMFPMSYARACRIRDAIKAQNEYDKVDISEADDE